MLLHNGVKSVISLFVRRKVHPVFCPANDRVSLGQGTMEQCLTHRWLLFTDRSDRAN